MKRQKHCIMYYAGYRHLTCDRNNHTHRLLNLKTNQVEIWKTTPDQTGIIYKNTHLRFIGVEERKGCTCSTK